MALIQWQTNAKRHLKSIFDYYRKNASLEVAFAMRDAIVNPVDRLEEFVRTLRGIDTPPARVRNSSKK